MEGVKGLESDLEAMRQYFRSGKTKDVAWRQSQLKGLLSFIKEKEKEISKALKEDLGKHHVEAYRDEVCCFLICCDFVFFFISELKISYKFPFYC